MAICSWRHRAALLGFQALYAPMRLSLPRRWRSGECQVGELAQLTDCTPAKVSHHMVLPAPQGPVCGNRARQFDRVATECALFVDSSQLRTALPVRTRNRAD